MEEVNGNRCFQTQPQQSMTNCDGHIGTPVLTASSYGMIAAIVSIACSHLINHAFVEASRAVRRAGFSSILTRNCKLPGPALEGAGWSRKSSCSITGYASSPSNSSPTECKTAACRGSEPTARRRAALRPGANASQFQLLLLHVSRSII